MSFFAQKPKVIDQVLPEFEAWEVELFKNSILRLLAQVLEMRPFKATNDLRIGLLFPSQGTPLLVIPWLKSNSLQQQQLCQNQI